MNKRIEKKQTVQGPYQEASMVLKHNSMQEINDVYMSKEHSPRRTADAKLNNKASMKNTLRRKSENLSQDREQYYKFYLESAQRAIDMMRKQHRNP